jgi:hypothetical protein
MKLEHFELSQILNTPDILHDYGSLRNEVPTVHIVFRRSMRNTERADRDPAENLQHERCYIGKMLAVSEIGKATRPKEGVQLCLGAGLDSRVLDHGQVESLGSCDGLAKVVTMRLGQGWGVDVGTYRIGAAKVGYACDFFYHLLVVGIVTRSCFNHRGRHTGPVHTSGLPGISVRDDCDALREPSASYHLGPQHLKGFVDGSCDKLSAFLRETLKSCTGKPAGHPSNYIHRILCKSLYAFRTIHSR